MLPSDNPSPHVLYLSIGSNLGNKEQNIADAIAKINERIGDIIQLSRNYITPPEGFHSENSFLNAACSVQTSLFPLEILDITEQIEREIGRTHKSTHTCYQDRLIDIDILFYDHLVLKSDRLQIPHPRIEERKFVLQPLAEIAPDFIHPLSGKTIQELLSGILS